MILIAWLVCVAIAGALLYVGLNAIAGLRDACANGATVQAPTGGSSAGRNGSLSRGITILPPGPRNRPVERGNGHDNSVIAIGSPIDAAAVTPSPAPGMAQPHQVERHPKIRKPGQQA